MSASEVRSRKVIVAMTEDQYAVLKRIADAQGYHVGAMAYLILSEYLERHG